MQQFDLKSPLKPALILLKILGLWPESDKGYDRKSLYFILSVYAMVALGIVNTSLQIINLFFIYHDLRLLTESIYVISLLATFKGICFIVYMPLWKELIATLNEEMFQPKTEFELAMIKRSFKNWKLSVISFATSATCCLFFWFIFPYFDKSIEKWHLPYICWYPYDHKRTPLFQITYAYQVVGLHYLGSVNIAFDFLSGGMMTYISGQCQLLCLHLRHLCDGRSSNREVKNLRQKFRNCMHHHKLILKFAENCNEAIDIPTFFQFGGSVYSICMTMFQLTMVTPFTSGFFSLVFYQICMFIEIFIYCWFGNEIFVHSSEIPYAIYESSWIGTPVRFQKDMLFFIMKTQSPIILRIVGFFRLVNATFASIVRTSWSYFALLRQVNSK